MTLAVACELSLEGVIPEVYGKGPSICQEANGRFQASQVSTAPRGSSGIPGGTSKSEGPSASLVVSVQIGEELVHG